MGAPSQDGTVHTRILQLATKGVSRIRERNSRDRQMKLGRNDPCPCGSGKKYNHCCLNAAAQAAAPADLTWHRMRGLLDG
jgi:SEC-C motif